MTTPRTVSGQAAISAMRPYVKRALGTTIIAIETEAAAPYLAALAAADRVLSELSEAEGSVSSELLERAEAARALATPLLSPPSPEELD